MEKRKKIGLLLLAVIGITVALIWGVRIQEMKNENTENLADEEKNDDLKGTTIASVILLEDQTEKVMQTAMRVTAEKYGATVIEGRAVENWKGKHDCSVTIWSRKWMQSAFIRSVRRDRLQVWKMRQNRELTFILWI